MPEPPRPHWAILQLRDPVEAVPIADIERDLKARWAPAICRFLAVKQGKLDPTNPLAAYVFVQTPLSPKLERSLFVTRFLRDPLTKRLQKISQVDLLQMAPTPPLPPPGATIAVTAGSYVGLQATVVAANCRTVRALVELWSTQTLLDLEPNEFVLV